MKNLKFLFLLLFFCNLSYSYNIDKTEHFKMNIYVVIVGVAKYKYINSLEYTKDDAYRIYAFYKSPEGGAIPDENINILIDEEATQKNILNSLNNLFSDAQSNDMIIFYFSGHGKEDAFLLYDSKGNENILKHKEIKDIFQNSKAKFKVCIADACHSGGLKKFKDYYNIIDEFYGSFNNIKGGMALFMSSAEDELSGEFEGIRQGVFSYYLIKGLKGNADENKDYKISLKELYNYVQKEVSSYTAGKQNPVLNGDYDEEMTMALLDNIPISPPVIEYIASTVTDYDGNVYKTIIIGNQTWMQENLNVEHYRNGDVIPQVQDNKEWDLLKTGAWCYLENDSKNGITFGKLYNWYVVNDVRGLAPKGWHIPSDAEWTKLTDYLGGEKVAESKLRTTSFWKSPGTNESGFSALPGGDRSFSGWFLGDNKMCCFWTSSEKSYMEAWQRCMGHIYSDVDRGVNYKSNGYSVRCVKD